MFLDMGVITGESMEDRSVLFIGCGTLKYVWVLSDPYVHTYALPMPFATA